MDEAVSAVPFDLASQLSRAQEAVKLCQDEISYQNRKRKEAEAEVERLRLPPEETMSDHPGCGFCMEAGTPVRPGQICPKCGDRLPSNDYYRGLELKKALREALEGWFIAEHHDESPSVFSLDRIKELRKLCDG